MSYADNFITPCDGCYQYSLPACQTGNIIIKGALGATASREWYVEDKFGHTYHGTDTTNASGDIEIPIADFPDGFFNAFTGVLTIFIKDTEAATAVHAMTLGGASHDCIRLTISDIDSTNLTIQ